MTDAHAGTRSLRIGLVGPIGCGKSTVARWLADAGATVVDADRHARDVLDPGEPALAEVVAAFGDGVLLPDGSLDRARLGELVFDDPDALARLEAIVHPAVRPRILAAIDAAEADGAPIVVLEAIRLVDAGYRPLMDEIWFVTCDPATQRDRLAARGLDADDAARRMSAQGALLERAAAAAHRTIETDGSLEDTRAAVIDTLEDARARTGR